MMKLKKFYIKMEFPLIKKILNIIFFSFLTLKRAFVFFLNNIIVILLFSYYKKIEF